MAKLLKNKSIVTIVSIVACIIILWVAYNYRVNRVRRRVSIPVAAEKLKPRTLLTDDNIAQIDVASTLLSDEVIRNKKELTDSIRGPLYVSYNTFVPEGGLFFYSTAITWQEMPDSAWADVSDDFSVVSLPITDGVSQLYANTIFPGDKIDIYVKYSEEGSGDTPIYGPLFTAVTVLAVKDQDGNHIFKKGPEQQQAQALIFALDHTNKNGEGNNFLIFEKALKIFGSSNMVPVPRNQKYTLDTEKSILVGSSQIINHINEIAPDVEIYDTDIIPESDGGIDSRYDNISLDDIKITQ